MTNGMAHSSSIMEDVFFVGDKCRRAPENLPCPEKDFRFYYVSPPPLPLPPGPPCSALHMQVLDGMF